MVKDYETLPLVTCNLSQLNQVFLNLLINACQAFKAHEIGTITLQTRYNEKNCSVSITVTDNGCGIPAENLTKIFDPFFTTKPVGVGTGLGLSISYGIIQKHGGSLSVESTVGKGTSFCISLPITTSITEFN